jgi:hypothetical protein
MSKGKKKSHKRSDRDRFAGGPPRTIDTIELDDDEGWLSSLFFDAEDTDHLLDEDLKLYRDSKREVKKKRRSQSSQPLCSLHSLSAPKTSRPKSLLVTPSVLVQPNQLRDEYPAFPVTLHSSQEDLISTLQSISSSSGYSVDLRVSDPLPMRLRQHKISRENAEIFSLSGESIRGPLTLLGKGSFGYALRCSRSRDSHEFVLKVDTRYNYALWDALVQAKVPRMDKTFSYPPLPLSLEIIVLLRWGNESNEVTLLSARGSTQIISSPWSVSSSSRFADSPDELTPSRMQQCS